MSVIAASTVRVSTLADGTLRLLVDIEPKDAQDAFALFGAPGRAVALAALVDGAGAVREPEPEKPKGGEWAKLAGMWCNDPDFWMWANRYADRKTIGIGLVTNPEEAAEFLRSACGIESRADLDHSGEALFRFNEQIRFPYMKFMQARGIRKAAP